ncbi:MAG: hypothetical protein NTX79_07850 [Candidatus Micrarchaeota archaeon]|nr:hypothetical protein [Candidatus Micrarchaeota archaeon]
MDEEEKTKLLGRAARLEAKMLFVKAAEVYLSLSMDAEAAVAYEKGSDYSRAAALFEKLGKPRDAARCRKLRDAASTGGTWMDMQAEFQKDAGNPY